MSFDEKFYHSEYIVVQVALFELSRAVYKKQKKKIPTDQLKIQPQENTVTKISIKYLCTHEERDRGTATDAQTQSDRNELICKHIWQYFIIYRNNSEQFNSFH